MNPLLGIPLVRGPVPLRVETMRCFFDAIDVRIIAQKDGATGCASVMFTPGPAFYPEKSHYLDLMDRILLNAADRALDMWLLDHETQQGWPPRDCLHGPDT